LCGGSVPVAPNDTWGGGSIIGRKKCHVHYYLNGPLRRDYLTSTI